MLKLAIYIILKISIRRKLSNKVNARMTQYYVLVKIYRVFVIYK